jgi:hypothetical protein
MRFFGMMCLLSAIVTLGIFSDADWSDWLISLFCSNWPSTEAWPFAVDSPEMSLDAKLSWVSC